MSPHPPRSVRTFNGQSRIYSYEGIDVPPDDDGVRGDWAVCYTDTEVLIFGPKIDATTWPAGVVNNGPTGPTGATGAPGNMAPWVTATAYVTGQVALFGGAMYLALSDHTSDASFRVDVAAGRWQVVNPKGQGRIETTDPVLMTGYQIWPVASRLYYFRTTGAGPISKIAVDVGTQSGNMVVSVWANNGLQGRAAAPVGPRLATSGSVAVPAALAVQEISLGGTVGVAEGDWFGIAIDNITARLRTAVSAGAVNLSNGRVGYELLSGLTLPANPTPIWAPTYHPWAAGIA